jgi:hypothetical protein
VEGGAHAGIESGETPKVNYRLPQKPGPKTAPELERIVDAMAALGDDFPGEPPNHKDWQKHFGAKARNYFRALTALQQRRKAD